jgi:hypothetical protein
VKSWLTQLFELRAKSWLTQLCMGLVFSPFGAYNQKQSMQTDGDSNEVEVLHSAE